MHGNVRKGEACQGSAGNISGEASVSLSPAPRRPGARRPWLGERGAVRVGWEGAAGGACHVIWRVCVGKKGRAESRAAAAAAAAAKA